KLGCKGPTTKSACATVKWNNGVSFPIEAGHPCLGCTEPNFWDGGGFYKPISVPAGDYRDLGLAAVAGGAALGAAGAAMAKARKSKAAKEHETVDAHDLEK
ncbi:Ni/Fe hydrogenase, partial [Pseudomonadota bacterium]